MRALGMLVMAAGALAATPAGAQQCPAAYTACDNGACCLASEQCCPTAAEGCCPAYAPYCCGNGTCAAAPAQCGAAGQAACEDYEVPCGSGCAPAGSDCCSAEGHYCAPETRCTSETSCVRGDTEADVFLTVPESMASPPERGPRSPLSDPPDATARSCALGGVPPGARGGAGRGQAAALVAVLALAARQWRRARAIAPRSTRRARGSRR